MAEDFSKVIEQKQEQDRKHYQERFDNLFKEFGGYENFKKTLKEMKQKRD